MTPSVRDNPDSPRARAMIRRSVLVGERGGLLGLHHAAGVLRVRVHERDAKGHEHLGPGQVIAEVWGGSEASVADAIRHHAPSHLQIAWIVRPARWWHRLHAWLRWRWWRLVSDPR